MGKLSTNRLAHMAAKKRVMILMALSSLDGARSYGGVDSVCQSHLKGLLQYGGDHDYIIVGFNPANDGDDEGEIHKLSENVTLYWHNVGRRSGRRQILPKLVRHELLIQRYARRFVPEVVHSHTPQWYIRKFPGSRKILSLHSYQQIAMKRVGPVSDFVHLRIVQPQSIISSDVLTTVSEEIEKLVQARFQKPVAYIGNAVDTDFDCNRRINSPDSKIRLMQIGNIEPRKGVLDALRVVNALRPQFSNIELWLAGRFNKDDDYYRTLVRYIQENELHDAVRFLGLVGREELISKTSQVHIGLFLSHSETFGLAPLEMLLAGVPMVTTQVGVFEQHRREFAGQGVMLIKPGDVAHAARVVSDMICRNNFFAHKQTSDFIKNLFSLEAITTRYIRLYS